MSKERNKDGKQGFHIPGLPTIRKTRKALTLLFAGTVVIVLLADLIIVGGAALILFNPKGLFRPVTAALPQKQRQLLLSVHDRVNAFAEKVTPWIRSPRPPISLEEVQNESKNIHEFIRDCRRTQLGRIGPEDPGSPIRVLAELDIINAYDRIRSYYLTLAETVAGGKR